MGGLMVWGVVIRHIGQENLSGMPYFFTILKVEDICLWIRHNM